MTAHSRAPTAHQAPSEETKCELLGGAAQTVRAAGVRRDAQRELTGEIEQAELEALITRAIDIQAPKGDEWHDEGRAEDLKAYAAADWLICSDEITRSQLDALPTEDNRLGAEAFQTMMCACIGGLARKSNRRGPHSPATRSTDRGGEQT